MKPEELQLISDFIKIGVPVLGALLAGFFGYLVARTSNSGMINRQNLEYDLLLIKESSLHIHEFDSVFHRYLFNIKYHNNLQQSLQDSGISDTEFINNEIGSSAEKLLTQSEELFEKNDSILAAQSKLSLIGASNTIEALNRYDEMVSSCSRELPESIEIYIEKRESLINEINKALEADRKKL